MAMSKQDFIELADTIKFWNEHVAGPSFQHFTPEQIEKLADFCRGQNRNFMKDRWLGYIAGTNGKPGGKVKR